MKGWYRENYRHSLAARGIDLKKYQGTWKQVSVEPTPWFQRDCKNVTAKYKLRKDGKVEVINSCDDHKIKGEATSISKDNRKLMVDFGFPFPPGEYNIEKVNDDYTEATVKGGEYTWKLRRAMAWRQDPTASAAEELAQSKGLDWENLPIGDKLRLMDEVDHANYMTPRTSYASKDYKFIGTKDETPQQFIEENTESHGDHSLANYWGSVTDMFSHPLTDMDGDWVSYNHAAGHEVLPSRDPIERSTERGAAVVGRVLSQANMEPLIDKEKDRSLRDAETDIFFGRRLSPKDDEHWKRKLELRDGPQERRQAMAYVPTYVAGDMAPIAADGVGTAGAAAVTFIPVAIGAAVIYGGAKYVKGQYDKDKKLVKKK